jgi:hypothetical protein
MPRQHEKQGARQIGNRVPFAARSMNGFCIRNEKGKVLGSRSAVEVRIY